MRIAAVVQKELLEIARNKLLLFSLIPLPLLFVGSPLAIVYFTNGRPVDPQEAQMYSRLSPSLAAMDPGTVGQIMVVSQFMLLLLMIPVIAPLTIATFSIIGEKQARSLEPLLATPIHTWELLLGKALGAAVPAVVATWTSYAILIGGMAAIASPLVFASMVSGMWMLAMVVLVPLLAVLAVSLGVMISSRVNDTRVAQQIGGLVALPLVGLGIAQTTGFILYDLRMFALGTAVIAAIDAAVLIASVKLFHRETILTRWK